MTGQENPHLKLASIIARKYVTIRAMGHGGYGVVYEVAQLKDPKMRFACKAEVINNHDNLKIEWQVMKVMKEKHAKHGVRAIERGQQSNFNYLVMSLMGPSLSDLRRRLPNRTFSLFTTSVVAIQTFDAVRELHDLGYLHRDVKPSNFVIGIMGTAKESLVHILDFGISRSIYKSASGQNIFRKPRKVVPFRGTLAYCSLNVHIRVEPGRHDDLWSWLYMLTEFHLGDLPWHGLDREHVKASKEEKQDELLEKCPCEFRLVRFHLDCLAYNKIPLYDELRELMCQVLVGNQFKLDVKLDWQAGGKHGDLFRRPKTYLTLKHTTYKTLLQGTKK